MPQNDRLLTFLGCLESSGYGRASHDYLSAMVESGYPVACRWLYWKEGRYREWVGGLEKPEFRQILSSNGLNWFDYRLLHTRVPKTLHSKTTMVHTVPEVWEQYFVPGEVNVGMTVWETDRIPDHWIKLVNKADAVVVPGAFSKRVFEASGIAVPIHVIPHCFRENNCEAQSRDGEFRAKYGIPQDHFVVYTINEWSPRKALWDTITAYLLAFTCLDPVTLVVKTAPTGAVSARSTKSAPVKSQLAGIMSNFPDAANVLLIDKKIPQEEITALHRQGQCYLSLTRGEGWGFGAFDAAALGNPVVMTGWGGQLDYLGEDYPYLVRYRMVSVIDKLGEKSYQPHQRWARADIDDAIDKLRSVYTQYQAAQDDVAQLALGIRDKYAAKRIAPMFERFL